MKPVARDELLPLGAYEQIRPRFIARIVEEKKQRRFSPAPELSVLFENHDTVMFQIQEMLRTERITAEAAVMHELETYNELIPAAGELSATMFVQIPDRETRERRLVELAGLEPLIALEMDGVAIPGRNETRGVLPDRTTAVHYIKFPLPPAQAAALAAGAEAPPAVTFVVSHPQLAVRTPLPPALVRALAADLA